MGGNTQVSYNDYGLIVEYHGLEGTENEKPSDVSMLNVSGNSPTVIFKYAPMTGNVEQDYNQLKNSGYNVTTNGGSVRIIFGKYCVLIDNVHAEAYINFDYQ